MQTTIVNGKLVITIPLADNPQPSSTGKTLIVASSHGTKQTTVEHKGRPISVSFNAFVKP